MMSSVLMQDYKSTICTFQSWPPWLCVLAVYGAEDREFEPCQPCNICPVNQLGIDDKLPEIDVLQKYMREVANVPNRIRN